MSSWSCHLLIVLSHPSWDFPSSWEKMTLSKLVPDILVIIRLQLLFKSSLLGGFLWHHAARERVMLPCHCQVGVEVQSLHMVSIETPEDGEVCCCLIRTKVLAPHLAFSDITTVWGRAGRRIPSPAGWGWKSRLPTQTLLTRVGVGPQFFLWCLAAVEPLLSKNLRSCLTVPFLSFG